MLFIALLCSAVLLARATPVDVTAFGAVGNGSTDNLAAIQGAINSLPPLAGGTVYFPPGIYNVSGTVTVPSNVRLQGMGIGPAYPNPPVTPLDNTQIRLTSAQTALFKVKNGASNVIFKDLTLVAYSVPFIPRYTDSDAAAIRTEGTAGISFETGPNAISNIVIEHVRAMQFTYGISAPGGIGAQTAITNVRIRNFVSDGNEYALYTNTTGADDWDVQNMNVFPVYDQQNGIFLERSGQMRFLQLSCAGGLQGTPGICAKLWGNGDTYFRQMHIEGIRLGVCVGSNCEPNSHGNMGENSSKITIENSTTDGQIHRTTNLVLINNRFYKDIPIVPGPSYPPAFKFFGTGINSTVQAWGNVWYSTLDPFNDTTVTPPANTFQNLINPPSNVNCAGSYLTSVPVFSTGYVADNERFNGEVNVTGYGATTLPGNDDTAAFNAAIIAARATRGKRVFVPAGSYNIASTLFLEEGETVLGVAGSVINLTSSSTSLFKVLNRNGNPVRGISLRNLTLTSDSNVGTKGIHLQSYDPVTQGSASDYQIQNVDFQGFDAGIAVTPFGDDRHNINPMFDSVSIRDGDFTGNTTAILIASANASNWNLENIRVNIPNAGEGVRIDDGGHISIRNLSCASPAAATACVKVNRQGGVAIDGMSAENADNALVASWETGWTQFPFTLRNSNLRAGVYFQGRVYLNSVNNIYPAKLMVPSTAKDVRFGALHEGTAKNIAFGGQSNVFTCNDIFRDIPPLLTTTTWTYTGVLLTAERICS